MKKYSKVQTIRLLLFFFALSTCLTTFFCKPYHKNVENHSLIADVGSSDNPGDNDNSSDAINPFVG